MFRGSALAATVSTRVTTASSDCCGSQNSDGAHGAVDKLGCEEPKEIAGDQDAIAEPPSLFQGGDKRRRGQF